VDIHKKTHTFKPLCHAVFTTYAQQQQAACELIVDIFSLYPQVVITS